MAQKYQEGQVLQFDVIPFAPKSYIQRSQRQVFLSTTSTINHSNSHPSSQRTNALSIDLFWLEGHPTICLKSVIDSSAFTLKFCEYVTSCLSLHLSVL